MNEQNTNKAVILKLLSIQHENQTDKYDDVNKHFKLS